MPRVLCKWRLKLLIDGQRFLIAVNWRSTWAVMFQPIGSENTTFVTAIHASSHSLCCRSNIVMQSSCETSPVQLEPQDALMFMPASLAPLAFASSIALGQPV